MATVNEFNTPIVAQNRAFNTYVPIPFDDIMKAGALKQGTSDATRQATADQLNALSNIQYIANTEDQRFVENELKPEIENIADEFMDKDLTNSIVKDQLRKRIGGLDKRRAQQIQRSHDFYSQNYLPTKLKMGEAYDPLIDPAYGDLTSGQFDSRYGIFDMLPEAAIDINKSVKPYFDGLQDTLLELDVESGVITEGVTQDIIDNIVDSNIGSVIQQPFMRQQITRARNLGDDRSAEVIAKKVMSGIGQKELRIQLRSLGYTGRKTSTGTEYIPQNTLYNRIFGSAVEEYQHSFDKGEVNPMGYTSKRDFNTWYSADETADKVPIHANDAIVKFSPSDSVLQNYEERQTYWEKYLSEEDRLSDINADLEHAKDQLDYAIRTPNDQLSGLELQKWKKAVAQLEREKTATHQELADIRKNALKASKGNDKLEDLKLIGTPEGKEQYMEMKSKYNEEDILGRIFENNPGLRLDFNIKTSGKNTKLIGDDLYVLGSTTVDEDMMQSLTNAAVRLGFKNADYKAWVGKYASKSGKDSYNIEMWVPVPHSRGADIRASQEATPTNQQIRKDSYNWSMQ